MTRSTNARLAGFTFLLYIAVGITQMILSSGMAGGEGAAARLALIAGHASQVRVNILLTLLTCVIALTLAVALYGLTRDVDRDLAVLALSFRVGEGMLAAIAPLASLGLLWLATSAAGPDAPDRGAAAALGAYLFVVRGWNTLVGASLFAVGSTLFSWLLLRGRRIPAPLAWLGVVASALLVVGLPLQLAGFIAGPKTQLLWIPMAAFEIPLGFWLLVKGVPPPEVA
jgi:uncharacterized protein DUF4386